MAVGKKPAGQLWLFVGIAVIASIVGAGFQQILWAKSEETYKGLKMFSDVIEMARRTEEVTRRLGEAVGYDEGQWNRARGNVSPLFPVLVDED